MKFFLILSSVVLLATEKSCKNQKAVDTCFKGRLEVKGGCMNYTISLQEGNMDTSWYVKEWTDDHSGKRYQNVFALGSRCNFPAGINEGDEFYFTIDSLAPQDCAVCMMYYPVPGKKLMIKVQDQPCEKK